MKIHSEWVPHCPLIEPGDRFTRLSAPITCQYCYNAIHINRARINEEVQEAVNLLSETVSEVEKG